MDPRSLVVLALAIVPGDVGCDTPSEAAGHSRGQPSAAQRTDPPKQSALAEARDSVTKHMGWKFETAREIEAALIEGDLDQVQRRAGELAAHRPTAYPETWMPFLIRLQESAGRTADADAIPVAAMKAAELALACGDCHDALRKGPKFVPETQPTAAIGDAARMQRHKWGAQRLWEGIVAPSDDLWTQGAQAFGDLPACAEDLGGERGPGDPTQGLHEQTAELGAKAIEAKTSAERAKIYGRLLGTCAACHAAAC